MITRPTNLWTAVVLPDDGDEGVAHICTGPAGRVLHSSLASDGEPMRPTYKYVAGTHTFYELKLAATPAAMVEAALQRANEDIADAYSELMRLAPVDPQQAPLQAIYSKAVAELHRGRDASNQAALASGDEALALHGRAATAFTRAQALAKQVHEALVPPATSPSDLGLEVFGGDWAEWETRIR